MFPSASNDLIAAVRHRQLVSRSRQIGGLPSAICFTRPMKGRCGLAAAATVIVGSLVAAGCSASPGPKALPAVSHDPGQASVSVALFQSPEQATLSWFSAVNRKDKTAAVAHFVSAAKGQMNWGNGGTSTWSTFSALHCGQVGRSVKAASVRCTFRESRSPSEGNPDSWWTVYLKRQLDGRWLITGYGQP